MARRSSLVDILDGMVDPPKKSVKVKFVMDSPHELRKSEDDEPLSLAKSMLDLLNGPRDSVERLAFETDPQIVNQYQSVYQAKLKLLPDALLKRIQIQDDLVAAIVRMRETQMGSFGRPRPDRFSTGFVIEANPGVMDKMNPEELRELDTRIQKAVHLFWTCGSTEDVDKKDHLSFAQYLQMTTRNAVGLGRMATEIIYSNKMGGEKVFHHFRPVDVGTIYKATPQRSAAEALRRQAIEMLKHLKGDDHKKSTIDDKRFENDEYAWIQVVDARPLQAFTDDEMRVHNFFPVLDVELGGYPVTPIDTMISAVTTHINITTHNKIYFQTGRAARGMLVFKSDDVDEETLHRVKQQFNASINSVNNAWRMPVFSVGSKDDITWEPIDNSSRDAEFQYLTDMNARVIMSAFQMSPDELPGWAYLSRGTNNQSLSESDNEYRLEAARDSGVRPLMMQLEDFVNAVLFPLVDLNLSKLCRFKLKGLDAYTEEKESQALQLNLPIHMTINEVLRKVEKQPIPRQFGGDFLLNPQWQAQIDKYRYVDEILTQFFGLPPDPALHYIRDPFYFQNLQMQMQAQQMQQQAAAGGAPPGGGGDDGGPPQGGGGDDGGGGDEAPGADTEKQKTEQSEQGAPQAPPAGEDLSRSIDQAMQVLTKGEKDLPPSKRKLLARHRATIEKLRDGLSADLSEATDEILKEVKQLRV